MFPLRKLLFFILIAFIFPYMPFAAFCQGQAGKVVGIKGLVWLGPSIMGPWTEVSAGQGLREGDFILTQDGARCAIILNDGSQIYLHGRTTIQIKLSNPKEATPPKGLLERVAFTGLRSLCRLIGGRVWLRAPVSAEWEIGVVAVGVRGTELAMDLDIQTQEGSISVLSGTVEVRHPLGELVLKAMERARFDPQEAPRKEAILLRPKGSVQWLLRNPVWISPRDITLAHKVQWPSHLMEALKAREDGRLDEAMKMVFPMEDEASAVLKAWVLMDSGRHSEALAMFSNLDVGKPVVLWGLAISLIKNGLLREALVLLAQAITRFPDDEIVAAIGGAISLAVVDGEEASRLLQGFSEDPQEPLLALQRGLLLLISDDLEGAEAHLRLAEGASHHAPTYHLLASAISRARGDLERAYLSAKRASSLDPFYVPALIQAAELSFGLELTEQTRHYLSMARKVDPRGLQVRILEGFLALSLGRLNETKETFREILAADPLSSEAHMGMGIILMREGNPEEALEEFMAASLSEPLASLPLSYLAKALHAIGRSKEALKYLQRASELDPMDPTPHLYKGIILRDLNMPGEAIGALEASISKNRARCVFRSRFLLDQDAAVRNVNLAQAFRDMGFTARSKLHAVISIKEDPTNSSGHLFMSSPFIDEGKTRAGIRELFRAQMLAPANANLFNTFHDYTTMFEGPRISGELEGGVGQMNHSSGSLFLNGGTHGLAGSVLVLGHEDKGFHRENHSQRDAMARLDSKLTLHPGHEILFRFSATRWAQGDHQGDADAEWVQDPYLHQKGEISTTVLGYRWHLGPRQELLAYGILGFQGFRLEDKNEFEVFPSTVARMDLDWRFAQRLTQFGLVNMGRAREHRWEWGVHLARGREELDSSSLIRLRNVGGYLGSIMSNDLNRLDSWMVEAHLGDIWSIAPLMFLEGSVHFQSLKAGQSPPVFSEISHQRTIMGPRLGFVWVLAEGEVLRLSLARYLEPPYTLMEGLQPVEVAGFGLGQDSKAASLNHEGRLSWDRAWGPFLFTQVELGLRRQRSWEAAFGTRDLQAIDQWELEGLGQLEVLLLPTVSLRGVYRFSSMRLKEVNHPPEVWKGESWGEHRGILELRWIHPNGWKALIRQTGVLQIGDLGPLGDKQEALWTDVELEKLLFGRKILAKAVVRNLFDQPFRLKSRGLVAEKGRPVRHVMFALRFVF